MGSRRLRHLSFLLRLWRAKQNGHLVWRASLDNVSTNERIVFANLNALVEYLKQLDKPSNASKPGGAPDENPG